MKSKKKKSHIKKPSPLKCNKKPKDKVDKKKSFTHNKHKLKANPKNLKKALQKKMNC